MALNSMRGQMTAALLFVMMACALCGDEQVPTAKLTQSGVLLPLVGFGCSSGVRKQHVASALRLGYRHIDTARGTTWGYNEAEVGEAIAASDVPRKELFLQTKIHPEDLGYDATQKAFKDALSRLQVDYVDSLLIHKPHCWEGACERTPEGTWQDSWRLLMELHAEGKARHIGICDANDEILDEMARMGRLPDIIQNWMDPFQQDKQVRQRCKQDGVQYQAYSTLGPQWVHFRGFTTNPVMANEALHDIAKRYKVTVPQVVIQWATRRGVAVLPSSRSEPHQASNLASFGFSLSEQDLTEVDALDGRVPQREL